MSFSLKRGLFFTIAIFYLLCSVAHASAGDATIQLCTDEWTWQADDVATFSGTIVIDSGDIDDASLAVSFKTNDQGENGSVVFTEANGKNFTTRKQKEECKIALKGNGAVNTFSGKWLLPEETDKITSITISVTARDADGHDIGTAELVVGDGNDATAPGESKGSVFDRIRMDKYILYLSIFAAVIWIAAVFRSVYIQKKIREER